MVVPDVVLVAFVVCLIAAAACVRVVKQFERGVVFRFGRVRPTIRPPVLALLVPIADRLHLGSVRSRGPGPS